MIVALGATERAAEPDGAERAHAVGAVFGEIFFGLDAAFRGRAIQPVIGRGHFLLGGRVRNQIAGQLFTRKLIERLVVAEGLEHVVAIGPRGKRIVSVESAGVGVADRVEPVHGLLLGIARRGQQAVDYFLVGAGGSVVQKFTHLG